MFQKYIVENFCDIALDIRNKRVGGRVEGEPEVEFVCYGIVIRTSESNLGAYGENVTLFKKCNVS